MADLGPPGDRDGCVQAVTTATRCTELIDPAFALSHGFADGGLGTTDTLVGEIDEPGRIIADTTDMAIT